MFGAGTGGGSGTRRALEVWKDIEAMFLVSSVMSGRQLLLFIEERNSVCERVCVCVRWKGKE